MVGALFLSDQILCRCCDGCAMMLFFFESDFTYIGVVSIELGLRFSNSCKPRWIAKRSTKFGDLSYYLKKVLEISTYKSTLYFTNIYSLFYHLGIMSNLVLVSDFKFIYIFFYYYLLRYFYFWKKNSIKCMHKGSLP